MMSFLYPKPSQENTKILCDHHHLDEEDEATETLSLCDLEIYKDVATSQEFDSTSSSPSSSSLEQDLFEFFSEEWTATSLTSFVPCNTQPPQNIIFCGKLIPSKQNPSSSPTRFPSKPTNMKKSRGLFRWNSVKPATGSNTSSTSTPPISKSLPVKGKPGGKNDIVPKRVSIFQSPTKSRWYLFLFGMGGFPTKMELSDIRSRQLRRNASITLRMNGDDHEEVGGSGRLKLIRALGCGGVNQTNALGKASVGYGCFGGV